MTKTHRGFGLLFWINVVSFLVWGGVLWAASDFPEERIARYATSLLSLCIIFPLVGLNATALLSRFAHRTFDVWEILFFTAVFSLFLPAFPMTLFASADIPITPFLPILFAALFFLFAVWIHPKFLESLQVKKTSSKDAGLFLSALLFYSGFIWLIVSAYPALPDLDPYYWLTRYKTELIAGDLPPIGDYRPLFASLTYLFHQTAGIDLFAYFKYVLPLLSLASLFPLMLIARQLDSLFSRLAVFTLPLATASFALYTLTPIPQSLFNVAFIFFLAAIFQSGRSDTRFYLTVGGVILAFSTLYHEIALPPLILWIIFVTVYERVFIAAYVRQHIFPVILMTLLIIDLGYPLLIQASGFLGTGLAQVLYHVFPITLNITFPATYVNIDGNAVGWSDQQGIIKYYAYYAGPAALLALLTLSVFGKETLSLLRNGRSNTKMLLVWIFAFFFLLAEILPRFFNVAFLPERAWGYAAISLLAFALFSLSALPSKLRQWLTIGTLIGGCISAGGALYINSLKQYLLTPIHFASAEWIKSATPNNRIVFSHRYQNLLRVHGQSETVDAPSPDLFSDIHVFDKLLQSYQTNQHSHWGAVDHYLDDFPLYYEKLFQARQGQDSEAFSLALRRLETRIHTLRTKMEQAVLDTDKDWPAVYIYYAKPSEHNPYMERPYMEKSRIVEPDHFCFDRYPNRFQRVYTLPGDEVVIWKLIQ